MNVLSVDPFIIGGGVSLPADKVLLLPFVDSIVQYFLNDVFLLSIDQFRGWLTVLFSVCICFMMWDQTIHMENIVHLERWREFDAICNG